MRFPLEFEKNMPRVTFTSFEYIMPAVNIKAENMTRKAGGYGPITLFLPGDYNERIQASWAMQDVIGGAAKGFEDMLGTEFLNAAKATLGQKVTSTIQAAAASVPYPTDILIFEKVDPIQLNFTFDMVPISDKEGKSIVSICNEFKKSILPKVDPNNKVPRLLFPPIWTISFQGVNGLGLEDPNKYYDMALTSVGVSFPSSNTSILVYRDKNPVQTRLNLTFQSIRKHRTM